MLARRDLVAYSMLALPLAMAALPIYVHVPKYYATTVGAPLTLIGIILFAARLFDAFQDPLLGYLSDRAGAERWGRRLLIVVGAPLLAVGFVALFHPPAAGPVAVSAWLAFALAIVYLGFSAASISYLAIGAELTTDYHERTRVTAARGAFGIAGILLAAVMPELLSQLNGANVGLVQFSVIFVPVLLFCSVMMLKFTPQQRRHRRTKVFSWQAMFAPLQQPEFRWLLAVSVPSGIASAIPATLILFFVDDVLQAPGLAGYFLAAYFIGGALAMPAWVAVSRRTGKRNAWMLGMLLAVAAFVWAFALGPGDVLPFVFVCVMSGIAYGAELALPPSILADLVDRSDGHGGSNGAYFGLWQMIEKLNLAVAAGIALPLLAIFDYVPGALSSNLFALSAAYALLPCVIKLASVVVLRISAIERSWTHPGAIRARET